jgi:hypothetical protein
VRVRNGSSVHDATDHAWAGRGVLPPARTSRLRLLRGDCLLSTDRTRSSVRVTVGRVPPPVRGLRGGQLEAGGAIDPLAFSVYGHPNRVAAQRENARQA